MGVGKRKKKERCKGRKGQCQEELSLLKESELTSIHFACCNKTVSNLQEPSDQDKRRVKISTRIQQSTQTQ